MRKDRHAIPGVLESPGLDELRRMYPSAIVANKKSGEEIVAWLKKRFTLLAIPDDVARSGARTFILNLTANNKPSWESVPTPQQVDIHGFEVVRDDRSETYYGDREIDRPITVMVDFFTGKAIVTASNRLRLELVIHSGITQQDIDNPDAGYLEFYLLTIHSYRLLMGKCSEPE